MQGKNKQKHLNSFSQLKILIYSLVIVRVLMILIPLSYDYPDEYWQGPQIAYKIYNKLIENKDIGIQTWQWTINQPIRNPVYQYLLGIGYVMMHGLEKLVEFVQQHYGLFQSINQPHLDYLLEIGPKIVQSFLAIIGDIFIIKLFIINFSHKQSKISAFSVLFLLSNWFYLSMLSRTYINSFQCILTTIAFYYWQLHYISNLKQIKSNSSIQIISKNDLKSRLIVLLAYASRPTSLIPWMVIWPFEMIDYFIELKKQNNNKNKDIAILCIKIIAKNIFQIFIMIFSSFIISSLYYHKPTLTEWNFFYYNVVMKWSSFFETHPFHFYFTHSLPFMEIGYALFLVVGFWKGIGWKKNVKRKFVCLQDKIKQKLFTKICWITVVLLVIQTLISEHKEHRFLLIFQPFFMIIKFKGFLVVRQFFTRSSKNKINSKRIYSILLAITVLINIFMFWSVALYPKGGINILREIRNSVDKIEKFDINESELVGIMYLCEAHALPANSIILRDVIIQLPDQSPIAKINGTSQINLLSKNPQEVYNQFMRNFEQKGDSNHITPQFIVLQQKFTAIKLEKDLKLSAIFSQKWRFIQKSYELIKVENNRNFWQKLIFGQDHLYLYKKKSLLKNDMI